MKIDLKPMPQPADGVCVGVADGEPLTYRGRDLYAGDRLVTMEEVGVDLMRAVDRAATEVLGHEWVNPLSRLLQINRRSTAKDRIVRFGLPEYALRFLAEASHHPHPRALGHALLCVEAIQDAHGVTVDRASTGRPMAVDYVERNRFVHDAMTKALAAVDTILEERAAFRQRKPVTDE
ncbi:hypothetical protein [Methylobacterium sp. J-070]|uniref:hypothetical protein n=1 Tax=Methylobacterium sp. J-070 TaxID=2836650 RepID=UPI001FBA8FBA|nr:hypothetical protein [Methylobacterium sp. J-070]MCJ2053558.1 hypothetical protein [Methylobacterium sp. J-070]